ncbi:uncharacterized protein LOC691286 isoform X3 [Rattus norvegicus]|uniref:uncharacterized protein LOC691286 isoform X3 n=1 Tax=Rattus norvegicus TaxID=10116 RepID=UPI002FD7B370
MMTWRPHPPCTTRLRNAVWPTLERAALQILAPRRDLIVWTMHPATPSRLLLACSLAFMPFSTAVTSQSESVAPFSGTSLALCSLPGTYSEPAHTISACRSGAVHSTVLWTGQS